MQKPKKKLNKQFFVKFHMDEVDGTTIAFNISSTYFRSYDHQVVIYGTRLHSKNAVV